MTIPRLNVSQDGAPTVRGLAGIGQIKFADSSFEDVLVRVAELAKHVMPGVTDASVYVPLRRGSHAVAFAGNLALDLDTAQYACGHGPGLTAAATGTTLVISDLLTEARWPTWSVHARARGARSSLSIGFPLNEAPTGAMNLYSRSSHAFDDSVVQLAESFVESTLTTITNAQEYAAFQELAQNLQSALESRAVIEQAKGIIMSERHCEQDEAFAILSTLSQRSNTRLREVAENLVEATVQGRSLDGDRPALEPAERSQSDTRRYRRNT